MCVKYSIKSLFLLIVVVFCLSVASDARASSWDIVELSTTVTPTVGGVATVTWEYPVDLNTSNTSFSEYAINTIPVDNNYWNATSSSHCYPRSGGSSAFSSNTQFVVDSSVHHTSNTSFGSPPCNVSGTYYILFFNYTASTTILYYASYYYNHEDNTFTGNGTSCGTETEVINLEPVNGTTTDNNVNFNLEMCIGTDDISAISHVRIRLHNVDQNVLLLNFLSPSDIVLYDALVENAGYFNFSTTTIIGDGNYRIEVCTRNAYFFAWLNNPYSQECTSNQFTVVEGSFIGTMTQNMWNDLNTSFSSSSATSTEALAISCNPLGGNFSVINCTLFLFVPDGTKIKESFFFLKDTIETNFPIGYLTDFIRILNSSSTVPLVVIDATIPDAFPFGQGQHVTLSLDGVLDFVLYATTSIYTNESAPSGGTVLDITMEYWVKIVYVLTLFYIIGRILGSHLIPTSNHFGNHGAVSDNSSTDDSYKLKEWLYTNRSEGVSPSDSYPSKDWLNEHKR